jgi:hypothetical protein
VALRQFQTRRAQFIEGSETRHFEVSFNGSSFGGARNGGGRLNPGP